MKKIFFILFLLGLVSCTSSSKEKLNGKEILEDEFNWHLTPGTYEEKEYAIQNPGEWIRIADQRKLGSQRNMWGVREEGEFIIVRLISYDEKKDQFLLSERVVLFEKDYFFSIFGYWFLPILLVLPMFLIWYILVSLFEEYITGTILSITILIAISWYCNWLIMYIEIILILRYLITDLYFSWMDWRKKKTKQ